MAISSSPASVIQIFQSYPESSYPKNATLLRSLDPPPGIFYLESGFVRMSTIFPDGREMTINIFKPGAFFPMVWAITGKPDTYFYQSITPVKIRLAPKDQVLTFIKNDPAALFDLTQRILTGMDGLFTHFQYLFGSDAPKKVASTLHTFALRFGVKVKSDILITLPFTHQDIAQLCGLTRETTSLELKKLENGGVISYQRRRILIKNLSFLENKLNS